MNKIKERKLLPDVLRGFAIFMVVLGHCIQECSGVDFKMNTLYFNDRIYQFIYSFHMPLFMMISGYFAWDSIDKVKEKPEKWKLLAKRSATLIIPILGWTCIEHVQLWIEQGRAYVAFWSIPLFVKYFSIRFLTNTWFLWAVFWCFLIVFFMHCYFRDYIGFYIIGFLLLFAIPDGMGLGAYKYMMPYFVTAFYYRGWQRNERKHFQYLNKIEKVADWAWIVMSGVLFFGLFSMFDENSFIYLSGYKLIGKDVIKQLGIDIYRMLIGFVGAGFFILLFRKILLMIPMYKFSMLTAIGKSSLGVYIISGYLIVKVGDLYGKYLYPNYLWNFLQAIVITVVAYLFTAILKKIPLLRWLVG